MRLITGAIAGGFWLLVLLVDSHALLWCVVSSIAAIALKEYFRIVLSPQDRLLQSGAILTAIAPLVFSISNTLGLVIAGLFLSLILQFLLVISRYTELSNPFLVLCQLAFGSAYIGLSAAHIVLLRALPDGQFWLLLLTIVICSSDTGAFYIGSLFGKTKLCPSISPGKTVEGFFGGLLFATCGALLFSFFAAPELNRIKLLFLALGLAALSVIGDLTESILKRSNNVKDSGAILPGHGGVLDRVDSLLIATPILYYILYLKLAVHL